MVVLLHPPGSWRKNRPDGGRVRSARPSLSKARAKLGVARCARDMARRRRFFFGLRQAPRSSPRALRQNLSRRARVAGTDRRAGRGSARCRASAARSRRRSLPTRGPPSAQIPCRAPAGATARYTGAARNRSPAEASESRGSQSVPITARPALSGTLRRNSWRDRVGR